MATSRHTRKRSLIISASILKYMGAATLGLPSDQHWTFAYPGATTKRLYRQLKRIRRVSFDVAVVHVGSNDCTQGASCTCRLDRAVENHNEDRKKNPKATLRPLKVSEGPALKPSEIYQRIEVSGVVWWVWWCGVTLTQHMMGGGLWLA